MIGKFSFLLLGAGRGGTSLLAGLFDYHSKLEVGFELFSQNYLMGKSISTTDVPTRAQSFVSACEQEARKFPDKTWGNKITTEQVYGLEDWNRDGSAPPVDVLSYFFGEALEDIKVIFILRDGRTCVRSKMSRTGQPLEQACQRWQYSVEVYQYLQNHHPNSYCFRYEDLLRSPTPLLIDMCAFLGIPFEGAMLQGTNSGKMLPEYRQGTMDTDKLALKDIPDGCEELIRTELELCGYL